MIVSTPGKSVWWETAPSSEPSAGLPSAWSHTSPEFSSVHAPMSFPSPHTPIQRLRELLIKTDQTKLVTSKDKQHNTVQQRSWGIPSLKIFHCLGYHHNYGRICNTYAWSLMYLLYNGLLQVLKLLKTYWKKIIFHLCRDMLFVQGEHLRILKQYVTTASL